MVVKSKTVQEQDEGDFVITRVIDAPRSLVFKAWTDPRLMARWWGPHRFTNPICEMDVRPGGAFRIVMRGPDGSEHPAKGLYHEIAEPQRLVFTIDHSELPDQWHDMVNPNRDKSAPKPALEALITVTFEEADNKTRLTVRVRFESSAMRDSFLKIGMNEGWSQSLERLVGIVTASTADREIVITRDFDAPREMVWKAMTDPKQVIHWWGPRGFTTTIEQMDVRPGGVWNHIMHGPDGTNYPNHSVFKEVVSPERLVYMHGGNKEGGAAIQFESTWTFDALQPGKTRVTIRMVFPSAADRDFVVKEFGAIEGGKQTLERLGEHLAKVRQ